VVERTFGWLTRCRRLCRDYERSTVHAEDLIKIAMIRLMAARLAGQQTRYRNIRPAVA
jgi:transposase